MEYILSLASPGSHFRQNIWVPYAWLVQYVLLCLLQMLLSLCRKWENMNLSTLITFSSALSAFVWSYQIGSHQKCKWTETLQQFCASPNFILYKEIEKEMSMISYLRETLVCLSNFSDVSRLPWLNMSLILTCHHSCWKEGFQACNADEILISTILARCKP